MSTIDYLEIISPPLLYDIAKHNVIPLLGSGFSRNAQGLSGGRKMPLWKDLGEQFAKLLKGYQYDGNPTNAISSFVESHGRTSLAEPSFKENTTLPYLGDNYFLVINKKHTKNGMDLVDGKFVATLRVSRSIPSLLQKIYENWLRENSQEIFEDKVEKYSKNLGVLINQVVVKNLKNRWGSLTKNGVLNLNLNLIKAPENVIDYIILHELCHMKIKEHSHHYWDMLHKFMPDYHDKIEWLKLNGNNLL